MDLAKMKEWARTSFVINREQVDWLIAECDRLTTELSTVEGERDELKADAVRLNMHLTAESRASKVNKAQAIKYQEAEERQKQRAEAAESSFVSMRDDRDRWQKLHDVNCANLAEIGYNNVQCAGKAIDLLATELLQVKGERDRYRALLERVSDAVGMPSCHCEEAWELIRAALHPATEACEDTEMCGCNGICNHPATEEV